MILIDAIGCSAVNRTRQVLECTCWSSWKLTTMMESNSIKVVKIYCIYRYNTTLTVIIFFSRKNSLSFFSKNPLFLDSMLRLSLSELVHKNLSGCNSKTNPAQTWGKTILSIQWTLIRWMGWYIKMDTHVFI